MGAGAETVGLLLPVHLPADPGLVLRVDIELQVVAARLGRDLLIERDRPRAFHGRAHLPGL
jgi:hypothetical protein